MNDVNRTALGEVALEIIDPFDLPEWLGTSEVTWFSDASNAPRQSTHLLTGWLGAGADSMELDLLAVDTAFPTPVAGSGDRTLVHQAWHNGQVVVARRLGRLTLAVPGTAFTAELILTSLGRLAKAVGGTPSRFCAALRVGTVAEPG